MRRAFFILVLAGAVSMANAGLVDTFDAGNTSVWTSTVTPQSYSSSNAVPVPGGTRYLGQNYAGDPGRIASAIVSPWLGSFNVSTPYGAETTTALAYGNITSTVNFGSSPNWNVDNAGSNLNLGGDTLRLNFNGNEQKLVVDVVLYSEAGYTKYKKTIAGDQFTPFTVDITAADLTSSSATSFNSLDSLYVKFSSTNSGDFDLASIEVVPEPTSLAALAVGAVALIRRRKSK